MAWCMYSMWMALLLCLVGLRTVAVPVDSLAEHEVISRKAREVTSTLRNNLTDFLELVRGQRPLDLVLILDRSAGIGAERFYLRERVLARHLVTQHAALHPDHVRLAVITFALDSTLVLDGIGSRDFNLGTKCDLFLGGYSSPWERNVVFINDKTVTPGTNIKQAFTQADSLLGQGRLARPGVSQVVFLQTDGDYTEDEDPIDAANLLKANGVTIMTLGIGSWLNPGSVRDLASRETYYGGFSDWHQLLKDNPWAPKITENYPFWNYQDNKACGTCTGASQCFCDVYSGQAQCRCSPGYYHDNQTAICSPCHVGSYKQDFGNEACAPCPGGFVTAQEASTVKSQCVCPSGASCQDNCQSNTCNRKQECTSQPDGSTSCSCRPGFSGPGCDVNTDNCADHKCENGATCVDRISDFACTCRFGFEGRFCEVDIDECKLDLCQNNATCKDGKNRFDCQCAKGWKGSYCQDVEDDHTTQAATPAPAPTPIPTSKPDGENNVPAGVTGSEPNSEVMTIVIPAAAGGLVLIITIVIVAAVCAVRRRGKEEKVPPPIVMMREQHYQRKFTPKTISQKFSGFWKKKTVRGNYWNDVVEGAPSAPPRRRPDLLSNSVNDLSEPVHNIDELYMDNQQISEPTGMEGWESYLEELESSNLIKRGCIVRSDGSKSAKTAAFMVDFKEVERLVELMENADMHVPVHVQYGEYHIRENDGTTAIGYSMSDIAEPEILVVSRTKKFVIVCIADAYSDDGKCAREVQWISDHIMSEGY